MRNLETSTFPSIVTNFLLSLDSGSEEELHYENPIPIASCSVSYSIVKTEPKSYPSALASEGQGENHMTKSNVGNIMHYELNILKKLQSVSDFANVDLLNLKM